MQRQCPVCQSPVPADAFTCPRCGARMPSDALGGATVSLPLGYSPSDEASPYAPPSSTPPASGPATTPPQPAPTFAPPASPYAPPSYAPPSNPPSGSQWGTPVTGPLGAKSNPDSQTSYPANYPPMGGYGAPPPPPPSPTTTTRHQPRRNNVGLWLVIVGVLFLVGAIVTGLILLNRGNAPVVANSTSRPTRTARPTDEPTPEIGLSFPTLEIPTPDLEFPTDVPFDTPTPIAPFDPGIAEATGTLFFDTGFQLESMPATGGPSTELAFTSTVSFSLGSGAISPDGSKAFYIDYAGDHTTLIVSNGDGTNAQTVGALNGAEPYDVFWSPDSTKIAFVQSDQDFDTNTAENIIVVDAVNKTFNQLTQAGGVSTDFDIAWSPDSSRFIYAQETTSGMDIHLVTADGSSDRMLFNEIFPTMGWLPDGRIVYDGYCEERFEFDICAFDPDQDPIKAVKIQDMDDYVLSGISPDGRWLMLDDYSNNIMLIRNIETGEDEIVAASNPNAFRMWLLWSPDGQYVTYLDYDVNSTFVYKIGSNQPSYPFLDHTLLFWTK